LFEGIPAKGKVISLNLPRKRDETGILTGLHRRDLMCGYMALSLFVKGLTTGQLEIEP